MQKSKIKWNQYQRAAILFHSAYVGDNLFFCFEPRIPYANCKHLGTAIWFVE